jgi:hypothetical protein
MAGILHGEFHPRATLRIRNDLGVVIFSIVVQGLTIKPLLNRRVTTTRVESMCAARSKFYAAVFQTAAKENGCYASEQESHGAFARIVYKGYKYSTCLEAGAPWSQLI